VAVGANTSAAAAIRRANDWLFDRPLVEGASVNARIEGSGDAIALDCSPDKSASAFVCPLPSGVELDQGKLVVEASRDGLPAEPAKYELHLDWADK